MSGPLPNQGDINEAPVAEGQGTEVLVVRWPTACSGVKQVPCQPSGRCFHTDVKGSNFLYFLTLHQVYSTLHTSREAMWEVADMSWVIAGLGREFSVLFPP